jgi:hypothetical protein
MPDASDPMGCQEAQAGEVRQTPLEQHRPTPVGIHISFPNIFLKLFHNGPSDAFVENGTEPGNINTAPRRARGVAAGTSGERGRSIQRSCCTGVCIFTVSGGAITPIWATARPLRPLGRGAQAGARDTRWGDQRHVPPARGEDLYPYSRGWRPWGGRAITGARGADTGHNAGGGDDACGRPRLFTAHQEERT